MIKQHKKAPVIAAMAFTTLLSQAAWANNEEATLSAPVFQADELSAAFEQSVEPIQMLALSEQEMKETEGAFVFLAPIIPLGMSMLGGAGVGSTLYGASVLYRSWDGTPNGTLNNAINNFSRTDLGWAAAGGAVGGAYSGALFRGVGYPGFVQQLRAPAIVQTPIRSGGAGVGFSTFGVHGYPTTNFNNGRGSSSSPNFGSYCYSCYRAR